KLSDAARTLNLTRILASVGIFCSVCGLRVSFFACLPRADDVSRDLFDRFCRSAYPQFCVGMLAGPCCCGWCGRRATAIGTNRRVCMAVATVRVKQPTHESRGTFLERLAANECRTCRSVWSSKSERLGQRRLRQVPRTPIWPRRECNVAHASTIIST